MPTAEPPPADGLVLRPFRAVRYNAAAVASISRVLSPPYDVIGEDLLDALEAADEHNVVRLILPRSADGSADYALAAQRWHGWQDAGVLRSDDTAALYVYEQASVDHVQRGLVGAVGLRPADARVILPHENTMAGPVSDRLALMTATEANLEPIILVYEGGQEARAAVAAADERPPLVDVRTGDGWRHRLWPLSEPGLLARIASELHPRRAVIADGHHRYATYLRYQAARHGTDGPADPRAAGAAPPADLRAGPGGRAAQDFGLALLVDAAAFGPQVHAIHRVVSGLSLATALERARPAFRAARCAGPGEAAHALREAERPAFVITDGEEHWLLDRPDPARLAAAMPADRSPAWRALDVAVAHELLIKDVWRLPDTEEIVGYEHNVTTAVSRARVVGGVAVLLKPTPVEAVTAVAAAGERMPRKSTLFTPKPASGLLMRDLRLG